jgi:hypothetical protein
LICTTHRWPVLGQPFGTCIKIKGNVKNCVLITYESNADFFVVQPVV